MADFLGKNVANPVAMLLSSAKMLDHLGFVKEGAATRTAINKVLSDGKVKTRDLGGFATTTQMTSAIVDNL